MSAIVLCPMLNVRKNIRLYEHQQRHNNREYSSMLEEEAMRMKGLICKPFD